MVQLRKSQIEPEIKVVKRESKDSERTVALTTKKKRANFYKKELEKKQRLKKVEENSIDPDEERILGNSHSSKDSD